MHAAVMKDAAAYWQRRARARMGVPPVAGVRTRTRGAAGWDPLVIWTPDLALQRINQIDAKISMLDRDIMAPTTHVDANFVKDWQAWKTGYAATVAQLKDSWITRGLTGTAEQLDAYDRELDAFRSQFRALGGVTVSPEITSQVSNPQNQPAPDNTWKTATFVLLGGLAVGAGVLLLSRITLRPQGG
jgi:hypothetical protein